MRHELFINEILPIILKIMEIVDLNQEHENAYFCCLEDWSDEIKEAGDHKTCWYRVMKEKGLRQACKGY